MKAFLKIAPLAILVFLAYFLFQKYQIREVVPERNQASAGAGVIHNDSDEIPGSDFSGTVDDIISLVNQARASEGLPPLKKNEKLNNSALMKAQDMKEKGYFEHVSPEGLQPWFFVEEADYQYKTVGENLAEGYFSAGSVHEAWMNSEGHRKNVVSEDFEDIGVAIVEIERNGLKSYIAVQHFGTRFDEKDLEPVTVCDKEAKENCKDAEKKKDEIEDTIDDQKDAIKDAKKQGASEDDLDRMEDNLEKLKDIEDEIDDYLDKCEDYIKKCDKWK